MIRRMLTVLGISLLMIASTGITTVAASGNERVSSRTIEAFQEATPTDKDATDKVVKFVKKWVRLFNLHDPRAIDLEAESIWYQGSHDNAVAAMKKATPLTLYVIDNVQITQTGATATMTYAGGFTTSSYYTLQIELQTNGDSYLIIGIRGHTPIIYGKLKDATARAKLTLTNDGLELDTTEFQNAQLVILETANLSADQPLSTAIYELPTGISIEEAQKMFVDGNFSGILRYVGPTPVQPGEIVSYAFLVKPGFRYLLQQVTLDESLLNASLLTGEAYATVFTNKID